MDHYTVDIEYDEENEKYDLKVNPLAPIPDDKKYEKKSDPFIIDNHPELTWLKGFQIEGYPDIIRVPFRTPPFQLEYVPARIEQYEEGHFTCIVLCEPKIDCKIHAGDTIDVVHFMFERMHHLRKTIEERNGFEWR